MIKINFETKVDESLAEATLAKITSSEMAGWLKLPFVDKNPCHVEIPQTEITSSKLEGPELDETRPSGPEFGKSELTAIKNAAAKIRGDSEYLVCIGIGGSYLGHRALIEALADFTDTDLTPSEASSTSEQLSHKVKQIIGAITESSSHLKGAPKTPKASKTASAPKAPQTPKILYAGNTLSDRALKKVLKTVENHDFSVNVISKSGTTLEPALAFMAFKNKLIEKYGQEGAAARIYATTDRDKGELHDEAVREHYHTFEVPDDVGGRYSVLSAVGLLPLAVAGVDIDELLRGAADFACQSFTFGAKESDESAVSGAGKPQQEGAAPDAKKPNNHSAVSNFENREKAAKIAVPASGKPNNESAVAVSEETQQDNVVASSETAHPSLDLTAWRFQNAKNNPALKYALMRAKLWQKGYDTEVFATFEPDTFYFNEWLKQLFGESEGKNRQGIFPASALYSTDLHSLGQFMQEGRRNLFETLINFPTDPVNEKLVQAVEKAHFRGGIPVLKITPSSYDAYGFGELIYFFELACALSATLAGVNPFDQPGVEAYKQELRSMLS